MSDLKEYERERERGSHITTTKKTLIAAAVLQQSVEGRKLCTLNRDDGDKKACYLL